MIEHAQFTPDQAHGYCNLAEKAATGMYPAQHAALEKGHGRMTEGVQTLQQATLEPAVSYRMAPLEDIRVRATGDGRTVEAYAAVFDTPTAIDDPDGQYLEVLDRTAFNRAITDAQPNGTRSRWRMQVLFNHGLSIHGTASERYSMPIGTPIEVRADGSGLYTVTRYHRTPLAEEILEMIKEGAIDGYSFSGQFRRSDPTGPRPYHRNHRGELPVIRRLESTLREYGPATFPAYEDAKIKVVRSVEELADTIVRLPYDERTRLASLLSVGSYENSPTADAPDSSGLVAEDSRPQGGEMRSGRPPKDEIRARRSEFIQRLKEVSR